MPRAHDLHDGLDQLLAGLALKAQALHEALREKGLAEAADLVTRAQA